MQLNGFTGPQHKYVRDDAREYLQRLPRGTTFDLAIVDPPTFSNSKRTEAVWDVQRDHGEVLNCLLQHMSPGGTVFFSTNFRRFKFDPAAFPPRRGLRNQPAHGPARLPQSAHPPLLEVVYLFLNIDRRTPACAVEIGNLPPIGRVPQA